MSVKVLLGTTNPSKVQRFKLMLTEYDAEFVTPPMLGITQEPEENGRTPEENARIKAAFYGQFCERVICNDSGLYFMDLKQDDPRQPGLHVRTPQGKRLDDDEMIAYYAALVHSLGGRAAAYYLDGIAVYNGGKIYGMTESMDVVRAHMFDFVDTPHPARHPGWPLDSLAVNRDTGLYFVESRDRVAQPVKENVVVGEYKRHLQAFLAQSLGLG